MCYNGDALPPVDPIEVVPRALTSCWPPSTGIDPRSQPPAPIAKVRAWSSFPMSVGCTTSTRSWPSALRSMAMTVAIDYFGRTAGVGKRGDEFAYKEHVPRTTLKGVTADTSAAVGHLRDQDANRPIFTLGFCFGGSNSWHQAAAGHGLAGAIGFYGNPLRPPRGQWKK